MPLAHCLPPQALPFSKIFLDPISPLFQADHCMFDATALEFGHLPLERQNIKHVYKTFVQKQESFLQTEHE